MLNDVFSDDYLMEINFKDAIKSYNFTNNIPKDFLFVKLKPDLPNYRRQYITNGVRSFLRDDLSFAFDIR